MRSTAIKSLLLPASRHRVLSVVLLTLLAVHSCHGKLLAQPRQQLVLADRLDRPHDGYCIDVAGSGNWIDVTVPLSAHNCKVGVAPDQAVRYDSASGQIRFHQLNVCMTALGRADRTLPQMPLLAQPCYSSVAPEPRPFASPALQAFDFSSDGRLRLRGTDLCVVAGNRSDTTFSAFDRWRALVMATCTDAPSELSVWLKPVQARW